MTSRRLSSRDTVTRWCFVRPWPRRSKINFTRSFDSHQRGCRDKIQCRRITDTGIVLTRRASAIALGQIEIISHANLVAIADHRRSGEGEHEAVGELDAPPIAIEHGHEPASDAAMIELHLLFRSEAFEYALALLLGQAAEIKLVVIAQK